MHYQQDWILMQIEMIIKLIRAILRKKDREYSFESTIVSEMELTESEIEKLTEYKRLDEAESIIFKKIDSDNSFDVETALLFYENINSFSDIELEEANFSRKRILEGIKKLCRKSKVIDSDTIDFLINSEIMSL